MNRQIVHQMVLAGRSEREDIISLVETIATIDRTIDALYRLSPDNRAALFQAIQSEKAAAADERRRMDLP